MALLNSEENIQLNDIMFTSANTTYILQLQIMNNLNFEVLVFKKHTSEGLEMWFSQKRAGHSNNKELSLNLRTYI